MDKIYKLTDENLKTHNGFQWTPGKWENINSVGGELCTDSFFHAYHDPIIAVLLNPIHVDFKNPILWKAEGDGEFKNDNQLKCGYKKMRVIKKIKLPHVTTEQRVIFAIKCALSVYKNGYFKKWAENWINSIDRSAKAAARALAAAERSAREAEAKAAAREARAAAAAEAREALAARAAAQAASEAAGAAAAAAARAAAQAAAWAAGAAAAAAAARAGAAEWAAAAAAARAGAEKIDIIKIAREIIKY